MLCGILLQQDLEVGGACREDHLVCIAALTIRGDGHIGEGFLVPQMLEAGYHVGLEIVPSQAELLLIVHPGLGSDLSEIKRCDKGVYCSTSCTITFSCQDPSVVGQTIDLTDSTMAEGASGEAMADSP